MMPAAPHPVSPDLTAASQEDASPRVDATQVSLVGATRQDLAALLTRLGVPEREVRMRVGQLWHWIYVRGVTSFATMTTIGKPLRALLEAHCTLARP